jgi:hypothetical protein
MWKQLFALLFGLCVFSIGPGDEGGGGPGDEEGGEGDEGEGGEPEGDAGEEEGEGEGEGAGGDSRAANIKALRQKAQTEREARIAAEARLQALEQSNRELSTRVNGNVHKREEEVIPADETPEQKFVRVGNKVLNENKERVNQATLIAVDAADKVEFYSMAAENPLINKMKAKVEAELQRMRREENNRAPRVLIMRYLIGKEAEEAAIEKAKNPGRKTAAQAEAEGRTREARRGAGPLPKSDVSSRGGAKSDRQKREDRLADKTF